MPSVNVTITITFANNNINSPSILKILGVKGYMIWSPVIHYLVSRRRRLTSSKMGMGFLSIMKTRATSFSNVGIVSDYCIALFRIVPTKIVRISTIDGMRERLAPILLLLWWMKVATVDSFRESILKVRSGITTLDEECYDNILTVDSWLISFFFFFKEVLNWEAKFIEEIKTKQTKKCLTKLERKEQIIKTIKK